MLFVDEHELVGLIDALLRASLRCRDTQGLLVHTGVTSETARRVALGALVTAVGYSVAVEGTIFMPALSIFREEVNAKPD